MTPLHSASAQGGELLVDPSQRFARKEAAMAHTVKIISVNVDYSLPFDQMMKAGSYDRLNRYSEKLFGVVRQRISGHVPLHLMFFDSPPLVTSGHLFRELRRLQKRAAETAELLALGAAYPDFQRDFPIVAFGSPASGFCGGHARYPCLDTYQGCRRFTSVWDDPYSTFKRKGGCILAVPE